MATTAEIKSARELIELDVKEVSIVDSPANLREFLVWKSAGGNPMGVFEADDSDFGGDTDFETSDIEKASAAINALPDAAFAFVEPGGKKDDDGKTVPRSLRHFPHHNASVTDPNDNDSVDLPRLRNALARLNQAKLSADAIKKIGAHLNKHAKKLLPSSVAAQKRFELDDESKAAIEKTAAWMQQAATTSEDAPTTEIQKVASFLSGLVQNPPPEGADLDGGDPVDVTKAVKGETVEMMQARHAYEVAVVAKAKTDAGDKGDDAEGVDKGKGKETEETMKARHAAELKAAFPGAAPPFGKKPDDDGKKTKTQKSADGGDGDAGDAGGDTDLVRISADGSVHVAGQTVQKARSFTNARTQALSGAVSAMVKLLGEVDEPALKAALAGLKGGDLPNSPGVDSQVRPTAPTQKSADGGEGGDENPIVAALSKALEPITKRLDEIEKTRNPSQSVEGDGGSDTQTPVEKNGGFWKGVL